MGSTDMASSYIDLLNTSFSTPYSNSNVYGNESGQAVEITLGDEPTSADYQIVRLFRFYGLCTICSIGIVANMFGLYLFVNSRQITRTTTGHYLISLTIADTLLLVGDGLFAINLFDKNGPIIGLDFMMTIDFWCRSITFLRYAGRIWSSWMTVTITVERFVTVTFPLHVSTISTPTKAKIAIVCVMFMSFALAAFPFWTTGIDEFNTQLRCLITDKFEYDVWSWVSIRIGELIMPSIIVTVFTILIIHKLRKASLKRNAMSVRRGRRERARLRAEKHLNELLIAVAAVFLIVRLPYTVFYFLNLYKDEIWPDLAAWPSFALYALTNCMHVLAVTNYACNFFLYCLCGSTFRRELQRTLACRKRSRPSLGESDLTWSRATTNRCSPVFRKESDVSRFGSILKKPLRNGSTLSDIPISLLTETTSLSRTPKTSDSLSHEVPLSTEYLLQRDIRGRSPTRDRNIYVLDIAEDDISDEGRPDRNGTI